MVQVNIKNLIDDVQCYQTVRELRPPLSFFKPAVSRPSPRETDESSAYPILSHMSRPRCAAPRLAARR
jgi:hypothetical protein